MQSKAAAVARSRGTNGAWGFVKQATEKIERGIKEARSRSTTVPPRSASTTGSESTGKHQKIWDPIAIVAAVAEEAAAAESAPQSPAPQGQRERRARARRPRAPGDPTANADFDPAVRSRGPTALRRSRSPPQRRTRRRGGGNGYLEALSEPDTRAAWASAANVPTNETIEAFRTKGWVIEPRFDATDSEGIFRVLTNKSEGEDSARPSNVMDEGIATPPGRHFYRFFPEEIRDATSSIGNKFINEDNRTSATLRSIASHFGLYIPYRSEG